MSAGLKHNIAAMKETKQLPSFVQVLVTLEEAAAEIERLRALLAEMPDLIKDIDGGNPETTTGWASEELLDLWMRVNAALEPKP